MVRRPTTKAGRASAVPLLRPRAAVPSSGYSTPLSSAYPSTYASEAEFDTDDVSNIPIGALSLLDDGVSGKKPHRMRPKSFRFLDLPSELRIKVYKYHFAGTPDVVDLDSDNYKRIHRKLALMRTCRTIYSEATHLFYSTRTFRVFPTQPGRFFKTKKPLLARFSERQRSCITSLELRLGPGWNKPPRGWIVNPALGLVECVSVRRLTVFVECDPSDSVFNGFRRSDGFYESFSKTLLADVLRDMPFLDRVYFDAWSSVKISGDMMRGLLETARAQRRAVCWGPEKGWTDFDEEHRCEDKPSHATKATTLLNGIGMDVTIVA